MSRPRTAAAKGERRGSKSACADLDGANGPSSARPGIRPAWRDRAQRDGAPVGAETVSADTVFLFDVDNTLLDNDRVTDDLRQHLRTEFGRDADGYWTAYEALRDELGYADYLGALQRFRAEFEDADEADSAHRLLSMSSFLIDYPMADRLYPHAIDVLTRLSMFGTTVILSDGDVVFQPRKVKRSGLWDAVDARVLIFIHKERMLDVVRRRYPARRYVMVDDKLRVLRAMKDVWGERLLTVFVRQGHYALDPSQLDRYGAADLSIEHIAELLHLDIAAWLVTQKDSTP